MKNISCCGSSCEECQYHGNLCGGCSETGGKPFFTPDKPCPIYGCAVLERGGNSCAQCKALPCQIWQDTRDPQYTDEEFSESIRLRIQKLKEDVLC